jgi:hypothetical protein
MMDNRMMATPVVRERAQQQVLEQVRLQLLEREAECGGVKHQ